MKTRYIIIYSFCCLLFTGVCKKFLDEKTVKSHTVPAKPGDLQALLDYQATMVESDLASGEVSSGDYYLTDAVWAALASENYRRMYLWEKTDIFAPGNNDWSNAYRTVYVANEVLADLEKMEREGQEVSWNGIAGQAYFYRAKTFLQIAGLWAKAYDGQSAATDPGIPLRLKADFNEPSRRASVAETYGQILADFKAAASRLPNVTATPYRPSKAAAYGMLARVYLNMGHYREAGLYADSCLRIKGVLLDYNTLNTAAAYPFARYNVEVLSAGTTTTPPVLAPTRALIVPELFDLYEANDLRKVLYFNTNASRVSGYKGSYGGSAALFSGVAVDEVYLIRAESSVRQGQLNAGLADLNALLLKRYKAGTFVPLTASDGAAALELVLRERRKELVMRCLRWTDIKRLNQQGRQIVLKRTLKGVTYTLEPNDLRYALAIPEDVIRLSGMTQNP